MKKSGFIFIAIICSLFICGQEDSKIKQIRVEEKTEAELLKKPLIIVNMLGYQSKSYSSDILSGFDAENIESITVKKDTTTVAPDGVERQGCIIVKMKEAVILMTLDEIRSTYCKSNTPNCIYMINNKIITGDYSSMRIDRDYILKTIVTPSSILSLSENTPEFEIINIITKTKENIAEDKKIYIKGK